MSPQHPYDELLEELGPVAPPGGRRRTPTPRSSKSRPTREDAAFRARAAAGPRRRRPTARPRRPASRTTPACRPTSSSATSTTSTKRSAIADTPIRTCSGGRRLRPPGCRTPSNAAVAQDDLGGARAGRVQPELPRGHHPAAPPTASRDALPAGPTRGDARRGGRARPEQAGQFRRNAMPGTRRGALAAVLVGTWQVLRRPSAGVPTMGRSLSARRRGSPARGAPARCARRRRRHRGSPARATARGRGAARRGDQHVRAGSAPARSTRTRSSKTNTASRSIPGGADGGTRRRRDRTLAPRGRARRAVLRPIDAQGSATSPSARPGPRVSSSS